MACDAVQMGFAAAWHGACKQAKAPIQKNRRFGLCYIEEGETYGLLCEKRGVKGCGYVHAEGDSYHCPLLQSLIASTLPRTVFRSEAYSVRF